jgi:hypothetical protein
MKGRSNLVAFLVVGLLIGAFAGYITRPESAEIKLGPLQVVVTGDRVAQGGGSLTSSEIRYIAPSCPDRRRGRPRSRICGQGKELRQGL